MNKKEDNKMGIRPIGLFAVIEGEDGEKKQVDMRRVVGSKSKEKDKEEKHSNVK